MSVSASSGSNRIPETQPMVRLMVKVGNASRNGKKFNLERLGNDRNGHTQRTCSPNGHVHTGPSGELWHLYWQPARSAAHRSRVHLNVGNVRKGTRSRKVSQFSEFSKLQNRPHAMENCLDLHALVNNRIVHTQWKVVSIFIILVSDRIVHTQRTHLPPSSVPPGQCSLPSHSWCIGMHTSE